MSVKKIVKELLEKNSGLLQLKPAWVAREFGRPGKRLGLADDRYDLGERGGLCERWIASTTDADNRIKVPDEGLSFIKMAGKGNITLKQAVEQAPQEIMGREYAANHKSLDRLAKILDYSERIPYHIHHRQKHAKLVGRNSKEEAYYFPENVPMGKNPETFFGIHPYITREKKYDILLPHLVEWKDDSILRHSRAYQQIPNDGFHVPAGTLHGPGTALTIEFQEDSDVLAMLQAKVNDVSVAKDLLFKDVRKEDREKYGEKFILELIDWEINGDPYFYKNRHTPPVRINAIESAHYEEYWIFYNSKRFNGKKLVIRKEASLISKEKGVYNIFVWQGQGLINDITIEGQNSDKDEVLVSHDTAVKGINIKNTGDKDLILYKLFGPDINNDVPMLEHYDGF